MHTGPQGVCHWVTWLVLLPGASRFGGAAVMNLGQAYAKSSSYVESMPRIILPIFSLYLHSHGVHDVPSNAHAGIQASNGNSQELMHNAVLHRHPGS